MKPRKLRLILNGKSADAPELREAVDALRAAGQPIDVRVTWEKDDARRWAAETEEGETIVAAGATAHCTTSCRAS